MKVVISSYTFLPELGGVATHVACLAAAFARAGHQTTVITLTRGPTSGYGFEVIRAPSPLTLTTCYASADILILSNLSLRLIYPALIIRRRVGLWHHSESAFSTDFDGLARRSCRAIMDRAIHFATSRYIAKKGRLKNPLVIHPFIGPEHLAAFQEASREPRSGVLFAGRLEAEKGILHLLDRWPMVRDRLQVKTLRIAGFGTLSGEVAEFAAAHSGEIHFLGQLSITDVARAMHRSRYCIVPSLWNEPFGSVALEAIAAGALTICTSRGGLPEAVGELGFLYDPDCPNDLDTALRRARERELSHLSDSEKHTQYASAVARHIAKFSPDIAVKQIIAAFEKKPARPEIMPGPAA